MIGLGQGLVVALFALMAAGSLGYILFSRSAGKNRSMAMTIFAYGMLSSSLALIPISLLHFHLGSHAWLHIHGAGETFGAFIEECGLPIACALNDLLVATGGVLLGAFLLNQGASRLMMRKFRNSEDRELSQSMQGDLGIDESITLIVVKDKHPDAFSCGILGWDRLLPCAKDFIVITTALVKILDPDELRAVVAHELAHVRRKDNRYVPYFHSVSSLMFFDPLIRSIKNLVARRGEFAADREAASSTGDPMGLARALGKILIHDSERRPAPSAVGIMRGNKREIVLERIERLMVLAEEMASG